MKYRNREISYYELVNGNGRWYWDRRYLTEAEQEALQPPVLEKLLQEIDCSLAERTINMNIWPICPECGHRHDPDEPCPPPPDPGTA